MKNKRTAFKGKKSRVKVLQFPKKNRKRKTKVGCCWWGFHTAPRRRWNDPGVVIAHQITTSQRALHHSLSFALLVKSSSLPPLLRSVGNEASLAYGYGSSPGDTSLCRPFRRAARRLICLICTAYLFSSSSSCSLLFDGTPANKRTSPRSITKSNSPNKEYIHLKNELVRMH